MKITSRNCWTIYAGNTPARHPDTGRPMRYGSCAAAMLALKQTGLAPGTHCIAPTR